MPAPTAYPSESIEAQSQEGKGLDANMKQKANWSSLEFWPSSGENPYLVEYEGRGLLKGKKALITGADSGIGRAVAVLFSREGADISFIHLKEEEQDAQDTVKMIESAGRKANKMCIDLLEDGSAKKAVDTHMEVFGQLDILVNNSAMQEMCEDITQIDLAVVEKTFKLNIVGYFSMAKHAIPHMKRGSCIVNSGSVAGYMSNPTLLDYASTKGAIHTFTRGLAQQLAPKGIRVNAVAPGIIWTPLQPATKNNPAEAMDSLGVGTAPMDRPGMPVEVATAYVFLASPLGSYTTGETIHVTGGFEMQG